MTTVPLVAGRYIGRIERGAVAIEGTIIDLPAPLVPADVDLRDFPMPREVFAQMAVLQFGVTIEEARTHVDRIADRMETVRRRSFKRKKA